MSVHFVTQIPPGLTCVTCQQPFTQQLAARTDTGWTHATSCLDGDTPGPIGQCTVPDCTDRRHARGYCQTHYGRWTRHGDPLAGKPAAPPIHIEDIEWMVETGECITGAARRTGRTTIALERLLIRAGRRDLLNALTNREGDWNHPGNYAHSKRKAVA